MTDEHEHDGDETAPGATEGTGEDFPTESSVGTTPAVRDTDEVAETPETDAGTTAAPATPTPDATAGEQLGLDAIATDAAPPPDTWWAQGTAAEEPAEVEAGADTAERPGLEKAPPTVVGLDHLKTVLESLIFVADKPLTEKQLTQLARASVQEVRLAVAKLEQDYEGRGIELHLVAGGYQFRSSAKSAPFVRELVAPKPVRISRALLETLAIIAYRQPVTRPEIDEIRGVDSGEALKSLAERNLVRILGRKDEPGRPLLYGTTAHFLEFFGLSSLRDLPTLREYSELTDESRALFERRMGEPLDLKSVEAEARAAEEAAQTAMLETDEDDEDRVTDATEAGVESTLGEEPAGGASEASASDEATASDAPEDDRAEAPASDDDGDDEDEGAPEDDEEDDDLDEDEDDEEEDDDLDEDEDEEEDEEEDEDEDDEGEE